MTSEQALEQAERLGREIAPDSVLKAHIKDTGLEAPVSVSGRRGVLVDASGSPGTPSEEEIRRQIAMDKAIRELDAHISNAQRNNREWLEYNPDVIAYLCGGEAPQAGYMMYKSIRLCMPGMAEEIARREKLTIDEIWYVEDGKLYREQK